METSNTPPVSPMSLDGFTSVTLNRAVTIEGHVYLPNLKHVVNAAILSAMGDAVATSKAAS